MRYGTEAVSVSIPEKNLLGIIKSHSDHIKKYEEEVILDALQNPIESPRLGEIVSPGEKICIVISDITRAWQKMGFYLPYVIEELNKAGIVDDDIIFLCATGSHRRQTKEEHEMLLGEKLSKRFQVIDHDCRDQDNMVYVGTTSFGNAVRVNKIAMDCDHILLTGAVVYHDLAGWGGGKKSILPGISAYESIMGNHSLSLNPIMGTGLNPRVRCGNALDNPLHLDMVEAADFVKPSFLLNVIMDDQGNIGKAVAGHYLKAHEVGQQLVEAMDGVTICKKADLVISSAGGYPKDIELYQASKALINATNAAKEGGNIILLSECIEGFGHDEVEQIIVNYNSNQEREAALRQNYTVAKYTGYLISEIAAAYDVILVSQMPPKTLEKINIQIVATLEEALEIVYAKKGIDLQTYLMPYGANTLPKMKE
jgi:nickel-dependent lactate racemase